MPDAQTNHPDVQYSGHPGGVLFVVAASAEARAVLAATGADPALAEAPWRLHRLAEGRVPADLVVSGIGKVNAAGALVRVFDPTRHAAVLSVGVAGVLPGGGLDIGGTVLANPSIYADEGLALEEVGGEGEQEGDGGRIRFLDTAAMGFPLGPEPICGAAIRPTPWLIERLRPMVDLVAPVATVSTCSGADVLAATVRERTVAAAEAMEGAAVLHALARLNTLAGASAGGAELRVISNTTGRRDRQRWDLRSALAELTRLVERTLAALGVSDVR